MEDRACTFAWTIRAILDFGRTRHPRTVLWKILRVKQIRVALVGKSPLMLAMIEKILSNHDDIVVAARLPQATLHSRKLKNVDVVICVADPDDSGADEAAKPLLIPQDLPRKFLTIAADGRHGTICVLLQSLRSIDDLSPSSLVAGIREAI